MLKIKEQTFDDLVTGLTFRFVVVPNSTSQYRMYVYGHNRLSDRQVLFDGDGNLAGIWTAVRESIEEIGDSFLNLQEQEFTDSITGLTFSLAENPGSEVATYRIHITGDIPFGNRDLYFDKNGKLAGSGTSVMRMGNHVQVVG